MGKPKCVVPRCKDTKSLRLRFPHPSSDSYNRFWKWLALIQNPVLHAADPMYVYKNKRICIKHFSPDRFVFGTTKLKRSALPDINIGERHKVIKGKDGKVRHDTLCLDLREISKDHCTLKDIDIGGDIENVALEDSFELETGLYKGQPITDQSIARNFRNQPSEEGMLPLLSQWMDSSDNSQENSEDCNTSNDIGEAPDTDHGNSMHDDAGSPEVASGHEESGSTLSSVKEGTNALRELLAGHTEETSLILFLSKAYEVAMKFPQDLKNQIKKDILDSICRAESQYEKIQSSAKI